MDQGRKVRTLGLAYWRPGRLQTCTQLSSKRRCRAVLDVCLLTKVAVNRLASCCCVQAQGPRSEVCMGGSSGSGPKCRGSASHHMLIGNWGCVALGRVSMVLLSQGTHSMCPAKQALLQFT